MDDIDTIFEEATALKQPKKAHKRTTGEKIIKVKSSVEAARASYKAARKQHRASIKRLKRDIKSHRLMIKQARGTYRLIKMQEK